MAGEVVVWQGPPDRPGHPVPPPGGRGLGGPGAGVRGRDKCSFAEIDRQVERARAEYDPAETERRRLAEAEQRHAHVHLGRVSADGLVPVEAIVDLADALALEKTLTAGAARFDPTLPLDVRRSMAARPARHRRRQRPSGSW